ncbi:MAG: TlyA family RNA methyltransferase [Peptococcaceae bacterium]|nr:TlyA family RNA methyltransferase [Peptococcaceae bacterium]
MTDNKERLDVFLHNSGYFDSRERAKSAIMAGNVWINDRKAEKPGMPVDKKARIKIDKGMPYVSRGGLKLEKALDKFEIDLSGKTVMDVGSSTGGFTDCALKRGAVMVYAVDVGYGQLAWELRTDPRVIVFERTNIRNLTCDSLINVPDFVTIDVSFISLEKVFPSVFQLTNGKASGIALIKPQFEAGRENVGKKGVVRSPQIHIQVLDRIYAFMMANSWGVIDLDFSPIKGPEGNIEYLMYFDLSGPNLLSAGFIEKLVTEAHTSLK